jgi:hypothetical protein
VARSRSFKWIAAGFIWLLILGALAVAYRYLSTREEAALRSAYDSLAEEAKAAGLAPRDLPEGADVDEINRLRDDLKRQLASARQHAEVWNAYVKARDAASAAGLPVPQLDASADSTVLKQETTRLLQQIPKAAKNRLAISIDAFSGYALLRSPELQRALAAEDIRLAFVDDAADYSERIQALAGKKTPLAVFTVDALVKASTSLGTLPGVIVMVIDESKGADAIVAFQDAVPGVDALNRPDLRVVATRDSPSETLARIVKARFSLPEWDLSHGWVDAQGARDVYQRILRADPKAPQVFALWEPYVAKALERQGTHVLIDSSNFPGSIVDVLVVESTFLAEPANAALVDKLVRAYFRTLFARRQDPDGMASLVMADAPTEQLDARQGKKLVDAIAWKNTRENYAHFGLLQPDESRGLALMSTVVASVTDVLVKTGAIPHDPTGGNPNLLVDDRIIRKLHLDRFYPGTGDGEDVHGVAEAPPLSDDEWTGLERVADLETEPITFARGSASLTPQSQAALRKLAQTLAAWPQYYLRVQGRARSDPDPQVNELNRKLAADRANAAANLITSTGISPHRVKSEGLEPTPRGGQAQTVTFVLLQAPY